MKLYEWLNDYTVTEHQIAIFEKTGITKFEPKTYQGFYFSDKEYLMGSYFLLKSRKTADFTKIVLPVCRLVRCRENKGKKRKSCFCRFQISKKK